MSEIVTQRRAWITTPLPEGRLVLESMSGHEGLGSPFAYDLALISLDPDIDLDSLLGQMMTVHLALSAGERLFNGIVVHAEHGLKQGDYTRYRVTLCPWLSLLQHTSNCRIFQAQSVVEIVKAIFRDNGFSDFEDSLNETYDPLEYCVQFCESDYNFVSRLMEREGIYYFFKHTDGRHTLVLADGYSAHQPADGYAEIPYKVDQGGGDDERLDSWLVAKQVLPGAFAAIDFDFMNPKAGLLSQLQADLGNAAGSYALFDYPGRYLTASAGDRRVKMRLQEAQVGYERATASGNTRGLSAGALFTLVDFPRDDQNKEYLVIAASFHFDVGGFTSGSSAMETTFDGNYVLIDSQTQFRPAFYAAKPRVEGPQTAIVVGPDGDEIWTDKYGRVKVQFHWDRFVTKPDEASCWVRVSQAWAGAKWGSMHIPRIGQEVIVDFLEGDPDRPIITGRVYNNDQMPPYDLPANQTQSGIKSRSTPNGGPSNFNEIRFEDKKGSEELFIQAEKTQTTNVKGSQSISVAGSRSISVGGDESTSVTGTRSATITKKETQTFKADREMQVTGTNLDEITGAHTGKYHAGRTETVESGDTLTVMGSDKTVTVHGNYNTTADTQFQVTQGANTLLIKNSVDVNSEGEIHLHNPKCSVDLKGGTVEIMAADEIKLTCGGATISLKKDGTIEITGSTKVTATGGGSAVELAAAGATVSGTKVSISGTAMTEVTGAIVKIN
jgi:type VI secretion system secreted protein VgrG